jgi:8-oxo-dGTP diphosphatase
LTPNGAPDAALVEVAAAVILHPDGSFLLGQRPVGKVYSGYWEFPGGKVEAGERARDALVRELREELGVIVLRAYPWIVQRFVYPHAHVALNFFRVLEWQGEPRAIEHQALSWARVNDLRVAPILPANGPVLKALGLPAVLGITCAAQTGAALALERLDRALERELRFVMVREPQMPRHELQAFAREVVVRCRAAGAEVVVNGDTEVAIACGANGVHLPARTLLAARQRPEFALCGASCHDETELQQAQALGLDYAVVGPVAATPTHPGQPGLGWACFTQMIEGTAIPIFAIGGMLTTDLEQAWHSGAHGVAMIRGAWEPTEQLLRGRI